jgi:hypothetical protein
MFYQAMRADNTPKAKAKQMYRAVLLLGPRYQILNLNTRTQ